MNIRNAGFSAACLGMLLGSAQASADCGVAHSRFKEGEVMCLTHHAFRCEPTGTWTRLPERCGADNVIRRKPMTKLYPAAPDVSASALAARPAQDAYRGQLEGRPVRCRALLGESLRLRRRVLCRGDIHLGTVAQHGECGDRGHRSVVNSCRCAQYTRNRGAVDGQDDIRGAQPRVLPCRRALARNSGDAARIVAHHAKSQNSERRAGIRSQSCARSCSVRRFYLCLDGMGAARRRLGPQCQPFQARAGGQ